jgi:flagellar biosynthetic protein FliR
MGLPVVCVVLLVNVGLATLARTVPQVNIFILGFLITISIGLLILTLAMPTTGMLFQRMIEQSIENGVGLLKYF